MAGSNSKNSQKNSDLSRAGTASPGKILVSGMIWDRHEVGAHRTAPPTRADSAQTDSRFRRTSASLLLLAALLLGALSPFNAGAQPATGTGAGQGLESARAAAEASARARGMARHTALRRWQEQRTAGGRPRGHAEHDVRLDARPRHPGPPLPRTRTCPFLAPHRAQDASAATAAPASSAAEGASEPQRIWLFLGVSEESGREGFLRVVNHSNQPGTVRIEAVDDAGSPRRAGGPWRSAPCRPST